MKKASKIFCLLVVSAFVTACNTEGKAPLVLSLDLSDAIALFNGNDRTLDDEDAAQSTDFGLYKINEKGIVKRVHIKSKKSDDDKYFIENPIFTDFLEVNDDYFYARLGTYDTNSNYFVNKKTGKAVHVIGEYSFHRYGYWFDSTSTKRDFSTDKDGNIYGRVYDYDLKSDILAKFTITDKKVTVSEIGKVLDDNLYKARFNEFAADSDGNVALFGTIDNAFGCYFVTANNETIKLESNRKGFWTGYDGAIYSYLNGNIEKLTYNKDKNQVDTTVVRAYSDLGNLDLINSKILYLDKTKEIYAYSTGSNYEFILYQLYGENVIDRPQVYTTEDLSYPGAKDSYFMKEYGYSYSGVFAGEDTIYIETYDGSEFVFNKIDTSKNMELSKSTYKVDYNDGVRLLADKKAVVFYWNEDSDINCPPGKNTAAMSVGIYDMDTGKMSEQNKFVTGNSDRSSVINLKTYKEN